MIKHIFCDLDGTLYHNGINTEDIKSIEQLEKEKIGFHIATGRIFNQANSMTKDDINIDGYYICENGSYIYDNNHNQIFKGTIDDNLVKKVISRFESEKATLYFKYNGSIVLTNDDNVLNKYTSDYIIDKQFIKKDKFDNNISNIGVVSKDIEELSRIELYLISEFEENLDIYFSAEHTINIVPKGVSKRKAIHKVCDILGASVDEIATIGDSPNDINMLKGIKYSFAMENARESVKENANYTARSVSEAIKIIKDINGNLK